MASHSRNLRKLITSDWSKVFAVGGSFVVASGYSLERLREKDSEVFAQNSTFASLTRLKRQFVSIFGDVNIHAESAQVSENRRVKKVDKPSQQKKIAHKRFEKFASLEYTNGELIMTPMDFIESVTQTNPRPRIGRRKVTEKDLDTLLRSTPKPSKNYKGHDFFQKLDTDGVLTFPEYCFLVACLTKTRSDIEIAYKTFDRDNSSKIEKREFEQFADAIAKHVVDIGSEAIPRTTLSQHFFGKGGTGKLAYDQFLSFIRSLQTEILMVEFTEFSKGLRTISEDEFARILLRHTQVPAEQQEKMMENLLKEGNPTFKGITFEEFCEFFYFLNNIEDFAVAVEIFSYAGQNLNKAAFQRAYKITTHGKEIPSTILDTMFLLFDVNNDGELSKKEFIGQMKDAVQRGFRYHTDEFIGWQGFKKCLVKERNATTEE
ncbi:calcium uptake protein 3, mitochondrial-like isoform X3 [Symsagittifera roscoffensis]|uniref:calcium uptake protein 3, mitochondrial-like isoform X3 n=1 Tax=Symsagittifera roscoffensis TaxID=84072 RepID=UPI00307C931F